jgi:hypothetical protein
MDKACELANLAKHHEAKASGIAAQLDRSIFSDDENAVAALEARIAEREAQLARRKAINAAFKKADGADKNQKLISLTKVGTITSAEAIEGSRLFALCPYETKPFPSYSITNLSANIRKDRERLVEVERRSARTAAAESAPGGVVIEGTGDYVRVTFAEKPEREVLDALRAADFHWAGGGWTGQRAKLPQAAIALMVLDGLKETTNG